MNRPKVLFAFSGLALIISIGLAAMATLTNENLWRYAIPLFVVGLIVFVWSIGKAFD